MLDGLHACSSFLRNDSSPVDEIVARSLAKWPNVPAVFGWLSLDRRGQWRIKGERVANSAMREFISRNYECDAQGRWYFQNGPQRVYVRLDYTPLVVHFEAAALVDHRGRPFLPRALLLDEAGNVLAEGEGTVALLDDRDLARVADRAQDLVAVKAADLPEKYRFVPDPAP
jgi:hypothetical protein